MSRLNRLFGHPDDIATFRPAIQTTAAKMVYGATLNRMIFFRNDTSTVDSTVHNDKAKMFVHTYFSPG